MVTVLLQKETIYSDEVDMLLAKKTAKYVIEQIDARTKENENKKAKKPVKKQTSELKSNIIKTNEENPESTQDKPETPLEVLPSSKISESFDEALNEQKKPRTRKSNSDKA